MGTVEHKPLWRVQGPPNEPKTDRNPNRNRRQATNPIGWIRVQRRLQLALLLPLHTTYVPPILYYTLQGPTMFGVLQRGQLNRRSAPERCRNSQVSKCFIGFSFSLSFYGNSLLLMFN